MILDIRQLPKHFIYLMFSVENRTSPCYLTNTGLEIMGIPIKNKTIGQVGLPRTKNFTTA